jgi:hypothetical protein
VFTPFSRCHYNHGGCGDSWPTTERRDVYHPSVPSFRGLLVMIHRDPYRTCLSPPDAGHLQPQYRVFSEYLDVRLVIRPTAPSNCVGRNRGWFTVAQSSGTGRVQRPSCTCSLAQILRNSPKSPAASSGVQGTTVGPRVPLRNRFLLPSRARPSLSVRRLLDIDRTPY